MTKKFFYSTCVALALAAVATPAVAKTTKSNAPQVIYTGEIAKKVVGYQGTTPLNITVENGRITKIEALPNNETPAYFNKAKEKVFKQYIGKTVEEAAKLDADAATGATYSSEALIKNIKMGLQHNNAKKDASAKVGEVKSKEKSKKNKQKLRMKR